MKARRLLIGIVAVVFGLSTGRALKIVSEEEQLTVEYEGNNVTLECAVTGKGFNFFFNQVIWYKMLANGREVQINTGAIINEPFNGTQRYSIDPDFVTESQLVVLPLAITDIRLDDNGTYRCCLFQKQNILSSIVHTLMIPVAVDDLTLVVGETHPNATQQEEEEQKEEAEEAEEGNDSEAAIAAYEFEERRTTSVRCLSRGGNPLPQLRLFRGSDDISDEFAVKVSDQRTESLQKVLDVVLKDIEMSSDDFQADRQHHRKHLKCVARIPGHPELTRSVIGRINVRYAPKFVCPESRSAYLDTRNYKIDCIIRANPVVKFDDIWWEIADLNATSLTTGEAEGGFSAMASEDVTDGETVVKATLAIDTINWTKFGLYSLSARNEAGQNHFYIKLEAAIVEEPKRPAVLNVTIRTNGKSKKNPSRNAAFRFPPSGLLLVAILLTISF